MPVTMERPQSASAVRPFTFKATEAELEELRAASSHALAREGGRRG